MLRQKSWMTSWSLVPNGVVVVSSLITVSPWLRLGRGRWMHQMRLMIAKWQQDVKIMDVICVFFQVAGFFKRVSSMSEEWRSLGTGFVESKILTNHGADETWEGPLGYLISSPCVNADNPFFPRQINYPYNMFVTTSLWPSPKVEYSTSEKMVLAKKMSFLSRLTFSFRVALVGSPHWFCSVWTSIWPLKVTDVFF